ncbi:1-phosphofructokinase [Granulicatella balaenopterae]|uniref:Tagatose-6-phosphate kinase n=2 Tax=Granulicatella balaenopterae TaxID=137733 RepID=A0A1H9N5K0_9LACT|nr:1-phosphofructokinase [Granulicatella balaenopterae]
MIYTCTMNLAIDLCIQTENMYTDIVNRSQNCDYQPNGKGVNVSFVLKKLGLDSIALGFSGGFTGDFIKQELKKKDILTDFVEVEGLSRINAFINVMSLEEEYKLVNQGPSVTRENVNALIGKIKNISKGDYLVISGSHPTGISSTDYQLIGELSERNQFNLVLDISSDYLLNLLPYHPFLLKPNDDELLELFGSTDKSKENIIHLAKILIQKGAQQVLVSLGDQGAMYITEDKVLYVNAPKGKVVNSACAGDTLLATFIANKLKGKSDEEAVISAVAAGSSTAFQIGLTDFLDVDNLKRQIICKKI